MLRTYTLVIFFGVNFQECMAKEKEDKKLVAKLTPEQDDVSLFYSDLMPLLVSSMISEASILLYI